MLLSSPKEILFSTSLEIIKVKTYKTIILPAVLYGRGEGLGVGEKATLEWILKQ